MQHLGVGRPRIKQRSLKRQSLSKKAAVVGVGVAAFAEEACCREAMVLVDVGISHLAGVREAAVANDGRVNVAQDLSSSIYGGCVGGGPFSRWGEGAHPVAEAKAADGLVVSRGRGLRT